MKCNKLSTDAMKADIQAMPDGQTKETASKELEMAEEMMNQENMKACEDHMHKALEAIEE